MYFDELKIGMSSELEPVRMDKSEMIEFAKKYDNIPLHTDEEYAKKTHFKNLIAPGMMTHLEVWRKFIEIDFFGDELLAGKSTYIEWHKPVFADDILTGKAEITKLIDRNEKNGIAVLEITTVNSHGECVMTTKAEAIVRKSAR